MELSGDAAVVSGCRNRKRKRHVQQHSLEYPCVSRLRHRRLLAFLSRHDYHSTFDALVQETSVLFRVGHIQELVRQGRWADAASYVNRFVPPSRVRTGEAGLVFHEFLYIHHVLDCIVAGDHLRGAQVAASYQAPRQGQPQPLPWRHQAHTHPPHHSPLPSNQDYHVMHQTGLQISSVILVCLVSPAFVDFPLSLDFRTFSDKSLQAGVTGAPVGLDSPANSYGISTQTIAGFQLTLRVLLCRHDASVDH
ncbi:hypothetical protein OsI_16019 [Oryza sativa Indica Group]|uniref:CTLH domain-containing protein n=1 Tax=Oryza sativa subsp. indica TaxID=39946 RepID=B8AUE3_ORYSI|nr:hypothetical protein OsI_16019 [Oryza sativa Indica Group]